MPTPIRLIISFVLYGCLIQDSFGGPSLTPKVTDALVGDIDRSPYVASSSTSSSFPLTWSEDESSSMDATWRTHRPIIRQDEISSVGTSSHRSDAKSFSSSASDFSFQYNHELTPPDSEPPKGFTWRAKPLQEATSYSSFNRYDESPSEKILREVLAMKQKIATREDYVTSTSDKKKSKKVNFKSLVKAIMKFRSKSPRPPPPNTVEHASNLPVADVKKPLGRVTRNYLNLLRDPQSVQIEREIEYLEVSRILANHLSTGEEVDIEDNFRSLSEFCTEWIMKHPSNQLPKIYGGTQDLKDEVSKRLSSLASYTRSLDSLSAMFSENELLIKQATSDIIQVFGDHASAVQSLKSMKGWREIKTYHVLEPFPHLSVVARLFSPAGLRAPDSSYSLLGLQTVSPILSREWGVNDQQVETLIRVRRFVEICVSRMKTPAIQKQKRLDLEEWLAKITHELDVAVATSRFVDFRVILSTIREDLDPYPSLALILEQFSLTLPVSYFERTEETRETFPSTEDIIERIKKRASRLETYIASLPMGEILKISTPDVKPAPRSLEQVGQETTRDSTPARERKSVKELEDEDESFLENRWKATVAKKNLKSTFQRGVRQLIGGFKDNSEIIQGDAYIHIANTLGKHERLEHLVELFDPEKLKGSTLNSDLLEMSTIWPTSLNADFEGNIVHKYIDRLRGILNEELERLLPQYKTQFDQEVAGQLGMLENSLKDSFQLGDELTESTQYKIEQWIEKQAGIFPKDCESFCFGLILNYRVGSELVTKTHCDISTAIESHAEVLLDIFGPMDRTSDISPESWASVLKNPTEQVPKLREVAYQFHHATLTQLNIAKEWQWTLSLIAEGWSPELMRLLLDGAKKSIELNPGSHLAHLGH
ncbi:uncharacterized protein MELLADRAFT_112557 [Melampsora larici-populina 98AG31]|uniref:Secreted protein n=1 Tax=Melampsora larici-populina (strain 98AG31 / pathotype 3-4-7) TaxID=747676 RepID=F4S6V8_MELLP|nr:uncharacterized protein MELLADRAFT_112557 [Melampsora larici-populina 98AG31]EGF99656.1 hypothetical protein MELLADRAFT_112557 [Melampsora larici-populina 98AG31]